MVKKAGGYGWKTTNATIAGLPDMTFFLPSLPVTFIEMKIIVHAENKINMTKRQLYIMDKVKKTNCIAMYFVLVWVKGDSYYMLAPDVNRKTMTMPDEMLIFHKKDDIQKVMWEAYNAWYK